MTDFAPAAGRRRVLGGLLGLSLTGAGGAARAQAPAAPANPFPEGARLIVAGPEGGDLDDLARPLLPGLQRGLPPETPLRATPAGGVDGVTGANQFGTSAQPDGYAALLVPGSAAMAWLAGDRRVHYDAGTWMGVLAGIGPAVLVSRVDAAALRPGQVVRVGVTAPYGADIAGLLGLHLLGLAPVAVPNPAAAAGADPTLATFAQHATDMVLLHGRGLAERLAAAVAAGGRPICTLGMDDPATGLVRDPALPDLPHLGELGVAMGVRLADSPLAPAWRAAAATARLGFVLVLPALTPAAMVALWRRAADHLAGQADARGQAAGAGLRLVPGPAALSYLSPAMGLTTQSRAGFAAWMGTTMGQAGR